MSTRKILALLLAVVMACSLFVSPALAAEDEGIVAISDTVAPTFTDVDGHWAKDAIARWAEAGIIEGDGDGTVQPGRSLKRAELLTILARLLGLKETAPADTFTDVPAGAWYAEAVLKCAKAGIVQGFGNGMAQPESPVDREQAIVMIGRALGVKPAAGHSLDRFDDKDAVSDWAAPYMVALTSMDILSGIPQGDGVIVAPQTNIDRASTFALLDKAIAQYVTAPCTVTVDDVNKFVVINSAAEEAGDVTVTGKTAGVVVAAGTTDAVVLNNATVGTVKVDAPVDVTISRGSNVTDLDANAAADVTNNGAVTNLNTNADDVTFDGNKPSKVNTAEDVKPATDSKGNEVTEAPASSGSNNGGSTGPRPTQKADLVPAPLFDQAGIIEEANLGKITVTSSKVSGTDNEYNVTVKGENIMNHTSANAGNADGHWVGFGMPAAPQNDTFKYTVDGSEVPTIAGRTIEVNGKTYNTVYISEENDRTYAEHKIVVTNSADETVATYNVTCDVTFWSVADADVKVLATEADTTAVIEKLQADGTPWAHKFAKGLGLNAAVSGNTVTLDGETTLGKLESTYLGTPGCDGYLTYVLQVTNEAIKGIKLGNNAAALDELDLEGISLVMNKKIYDGTAKSFASAAATTFSLTDAAGRVQDEITVTVDASAVTIEGLKKATFMDGDKVVATLMDAARVTAPAVPAHTDEVYYTGNWISGETKVAAGATYTFVGDAKEITFTAETKPVGAAVAVVRPDGVAGDDRNFSYADAYTAAGIDYANGHITVDQSKTVALLNAAKGDDAAAETAQKQLTAITQMSGGEQANCLFIGLAVAAPDGATTLFVNGDEKTFPSVDNAGHDVFQGADGKYYYISYYPGIKADGSVCEAKSWPAEKLVWKNGTEVIKVENLTVTRDEATLAELTVNFVDLAGNAIEGLEAQTVAYQGKAAKPEAVELNGKLILGYYTAADKATAFDFSQGITANTTVYVDAETYEVAGVHAFDYACYDTADQRGTGAYWTALAYKMENANSKANHVKNSEGVWTSNLLLIAADKLTKVAKLDGDKLVVAEQSEVEVGKYKEEVTDKTVLWINATADSENLHDMGMTFKLGETEKTATWFFWYKEASDATPVLYKAVYEVPAAPEGIEVGTTKWEPTLFQEEMVPVTNTVVDLTWGATIVDGLNTYAEGKNAPALAEPTTPEQSGQGGEESTASLSAVETEEVIVLADAIVPSDDEVMEIPVLD